MTDLTVEEYSDKAIVVRGNTKPHKENLVRLGGKWNSALKQGGPGWIFSKKGEEAVVKYIETGTVKKTESKFSGDILQSVETYMKSLTSEQRCDFLNKVSQIGMKLSNDELPPNQLIDSGIGCTVSRMKSSSSSDEDVEVPPKRLLTKSSPTIPILGKSPWNKS